MAAEKCNLNLYKTLLFVSMLFITSCLVTPHAHAIEPVKISAQGIALDLSRAIEIKHSDGDTIQISTAPGADGIVRRIEVQANRANNKGNWAVFSIANPTNEQLDRLIVAPHYRLVGSGIFRPDLGNLRIYSITPSEGFSLDRVTSEDSDVFSITINPGAVITFVAELNCAHLPQIYLWQPDAYKDTLNAYTLYHGIVLGISGLLALLLSVLFLIRGTILFPATAAFSWAVLFYIGVDFHFLNKIFDISPLKEPFWRAVSEVGLVATLSLFLFTYLDLNRWHYKLRYGPILWVIGLFFVSILILYYPVFIAGLARIGLGIVILLGILLIAYFSLRNYDRAIMLIPTWLLLSFWAFGAFLCVTNRLDNDIVQLALAGGLVLIVLLIAFTVMQYAFSTGAFHQGLFSDTERRALAVFGAEDHVWDWDIRNDILSIAPNLSAYLGASAYKLEGNLRNWLNGLHPNDRDTFRSALETVLHNKNGQIKQNFRLYSGDNNYHWFSLRARPVISVDQELTHCIGILNNITEHKIAEERLLYNAIHDNLTHLPNRQLFIDRLQNLIHLAALNEKIKPTVLVIDFDDFRQINKLYGTSIGDSFLLIMAKRLSRAIKPQDTVSRLSSDKFAIIIAQETGSQEIANFAQLIQKTVTAPLKIGEHTINISVSIGLVSWSKHSENAEDVLQEANLAMIYAKRQGGNNIVPFRPNFKSLGLDQNSLKKDLVLALESDQIKIYYHPIMDFKKGRIVGFEALLRWHHPRHGILSPLDFISSTENTDFVLPFARFLFKNAARDLTKLQDSYPKKDYFISINLPDSDTLTQNFISEMKTILLHYPLKPGRLMIEVAENILMDNPEQAITLLDKMRELGFNIILDNFGKGYSALTYLVRYPFDMIKLDNSLIRSDSAQKKKILKSIIHLAHDFNIKTIAEGVETHEDAYILEQLGCDFVQSVTTNEPMPIEDVESLIEKNS